MDTVPNKVHQLFSAQLFHDRRQREVSSSFESCVRSGSWSSYGKGESFWCAVRWTAGRGWCTPTKAERGIFRSVLFSQERSRMSASDLNQTPPVDYLRPIIADGDTGHG